MERKLCNHFVSAKNILDPSMKPQLHSLYYNYLHYNSEPYQRYSHFKDNIVDESMKNWQVLWKINPVYTEAACIFLMEIDEQSRSLAIARENNDVEIWDTGTKKQKKVLSGHSQIVTSLAFMHGDPTSFFTSSVDKTIKYWRNYQSVAVMNQHNEWIRTLSLSFDNLRLLSGCVSSIIMLWDVETCKPISSAKLSEEQNDMNTINSLMFAHNSKSVFVSGTRDGIIRMYDARASLQPVFAFQAHSQKLNSVAFNCANTTLLSSGRDSAIRLWDIRKYLVKFIMYLFLNSPTAKSLSMKIF